VLCGRCKEMLTRLSLTRRPRVPWSKSPESLSHLVCARCGVVLSPRDPERVLQHKVSQLSRFGLGPDQDPLSEGPPSRRR
jgi:hypothetical protein